MAHQLVFWGCILAALVTFLRNPDQLLILMLAVVLLTAQGFVLNRLAGIDDPPGKKAPSALPGPQPAQPR